MSQGQFLNSRYERGTGGIHPIRVQPETLQLNLGGTPNDPPAGAVSDFISARVSGSRRGLGLFARTVTIAWTGTPPTGYDDRGQVTLPWMDATTFTTLGRGVSGTYLGADVQVVSTRGEAAR